MTTAVKTNLAEMYAEVRAYTKSICEPLQIEDYVVQPIQDVSPPKWHIAHTTWFFETFILKPNVTAYKVFHPDFDFMFNSYYEGVGERVVRAFRGNMSRPTVDEVYQYRKYVDAAMDKFLQSDDLTDEISTLVELGLQHEQQHQELLITDIKYILGHNPLFPRYKAHIETDETLYRPDRDEWITIPEGVYEIGHDGNGFSFDNELGRHKVFLGEYSIFSNPVTNAEYQEFIADGGYQNFRYWHAEAWDWVKSTGVYAPMYWYKMDNNWQTYTLSGLHPVRAKDPVAHVSFYEASAYASWKGYRLPTEFEWEVAASQLNWGRRWEWTESAYLPYPGFQRAEGAVGEYNGKFMVNQKVLRGASMATSPGHSRITYRNFFHPHLRWQFTGIRLAR
ncbi:MAG: ergothioneine biosynthesis protein EgtB [Mucilaginibacter polytrichastri]|nr:ergothioneine biosynthesis protein EgtB [Mucilaginibacter polytrichastri]